MVYNLYTGIPIKFKLPSTLKLKYTKHAQEAALDDELGTIRLRPSLKLKGAKIVEVETDSEGFPIKVVLRRKHDSKNDVCFAIALDSAEDGAYWVKTVWLNLRSEVKAPTKKLKRLRELQV